MNLLFKLMMRSGVAEAVETFLLNLSNPVNATILDSQGVGTIQRNPIIPSVTLSRTSGKAPLAVGFDATGTVSGHTTNPSHDLFYAWSFGDVAGETWAYGATVGLDKNAAFGPVAGHVFKSAGSFNWQCIVIDGRGNTATSSGTVTVSAWAAADTIYIANGTLPSAGGDVLAGATYYNETTWAGVVSRWAANKRIMLKRGDSWACASNTVVPTGCEINSYGAGTVATVTSAGATRNPFLLDAGQLDVRICNIKHTGPGAGVADAGMVTTNSLAASNLLMLACESDGSTYGLKTTAPSISNVFVQDCYFHDYGDVGVTDNLAVYIEKGYGVYLLGSFFDRAPSHVVRIAGTQNCVVDSCKIRRPDGSAAGRHALTIRELTGTPPETWNGSYVQDVIVSNNDIDSTGTTSEHTLHIKPQNNVSAGRYRRILVERNFVASDNTCFIASVGETLTTRSNIFKTTNGAGSVQAVILDNLSTVGDPSPVGAQFWNNTIYKTGAGAFTGFSLGATVTGCTIKNNLIYAPNATTPTAMTLAGTSVDTLESNNSSDALILSTRPWASATPTAMLDYTPTGYALGSGVWDYRSQKDFSNAPITAPVDIGAIQA